jgi:hypothetical protein
MPSPTFAYSSVVLATFLSGRTISFDPSVSGSARIRHHLSALKPTIKLFNHLAPFVMDRFMDVRSLAQ